MRKTPALEQLAAAPELKDLVFHLRGLLESQNRISDLAAKLNLEFGRSEEKFGQTLANLEVEIFFHVKYHIRELRRPFELLVAPEYRLLADLDKEPP
jgi:hypothetical protein